MRIKLAATGDLDEAEWRAVLACCSEAYEEDFDPSMAAIGPAMHLIGYEGDELVSHLCWVERWLQAAQDPLIRTAYVEAVATRPAHERRGYATALLRAVPGHVGDYEIAALSPSDPAFYARVGWEEWQGPLLVRTAGGAIEPPDDEESAMILRLPRTPPLSLAEPLSIEWRSGEVW